MTNEILLAGFGGQGILFMGKCSHISDFTRTRRFRGFLPTVPKCVAAPATARYV